MKPRRLHSDTILSMSTINESYLNGNSNNVMDRGVGVKKERDRQESITGSKSPLIPLFFQRGIVSVASLTPLLKRGEGEIFVRHAGAIITVNPTARLVHPHHWIDEIG